MKITNANEYGFLPDKSGIENRKALQKAVDETGTIYVNQPGEYKIAGSVYIGSNTAIKFGYGVFIKKADEVGKFSHIIINKGALTKTYDEHIKIENLCIIVNNIDIRKFEVFGLQGHISFHYVRDLVIEGFRCMDIGENQFAIHICTFEDIIIKDIILKGDKDGIHLGKGKRFYIGNGVFQTYDDAIALNGQDYDVCNPELGWIEDGVIENCHDLDDDKDRKVGFFCRALPGGWHDWFGGMEVQKSDTVVSEGRLYRVRAEADGKKFISKTRPTHLNGEKVLDGISWVMIQEDVEYTAGVRNVVFRNIFLNKPRVGFGLHFSYNVYNRSYYEGSVVPVQRRFLLDNIRVLHDKPTVFMEIGTPIDYLMITNSFFESTRIQFYSSTPLDDYRTTKLHITGCAFAKNDFSEIIDNEIGNKIIDMHTSANVFGL